MGWKVKSASSVPAFCLSFPRCEVEKENTQTHSQASARARPPVPAWLQGLHVEERAPLYSKSGVWCGARAGVWREGAASCLGGVCAPGRAKA